jgi:2-isopropylmalate synthase
MDPILLYDTTLRDGTQGENVTFSADEKLNIAMRLDDIGIHYIEGGWPGSNPRDVAFFNLAKRVNFKHARLAAFGSTRKPGIRPDRDNNLNALLQAETSAVTVFGKSWDLHVEKIMNNTLPENLAMINDSVSFLKQHGREIIYDAEHFFDGYKNNRDYTLQTLAAALDGGADFIVLCDTNGGTLPFELESIIAEVQQQLNSIGSGAPQGGSVQLGIHTHNDCGMAVANSITAVQNGALMVHGTINGYGERCGNADLTSIIPILSIKMDRKCVTHENLKKIKNLSRYVSETANLVPLNSRPFVGKSAFAHKGGIHVSAIMKIPKAYEHMDPTMVGTAVGFSYPIFPAKATWNTRPKNLGLKSAKTAWTAVRLLQRSNRWSRKGTSLILPTAPLKSCWKSLPINSNLILRSNPSGSLSKRTKISQPAPMPPSKSAWETKRRSLPAKDTDPSVPWTTPCAKRWINFIRIWIRCAWSISRCG